MNSGRASSCKAGYWPATLHAAEPPGIRRPVPTIMDGDAAVSRQVRAARIYPTKMAPAPRNCLEWFWWGLTAQIGKFAALDGDRQIEDHVRRIAEAVARGDRQLTRDLLVLAARTVGLGAGLPARFELLGAVGVTLAAIADSSLDAYELVRSGTGRGSVQAQLA